MVEAADDIVYATVDLEDALTKGVLNWDQVRQYLAEESANDGRVIDHLTKAESIADQSDLPLSKTTFFNVEGVVAELDTSNLQCGSIYEHGFLSGIRSMLLDVNFAENPFPALCIIRALHTAAKSEFTIGRRLATFLAESWQSVSLDDVLHSQQSHYGCSRLDASEIELWWQYVVQRHKSNSMDDIRLPISEKRRRELTRNRYARD